MTTRRPRRRQSDRKPRAFVRPEEDNLVTRAIAAHEEHTREGLGECWELLEKLPLPIGPAPRPCIGAEKG